MLLEAQGRGKAGQDFSWSVSDNSSGKMSKEWRGSVPPDSHLGSPSFERQKFVLLHS